MILHAKLQRAISYAKLQLSDIIRIRFQREHKHLVCMNILQLRMAFNFLKAFQYFVYEEEFMPLFLPFLIEEPRQVQSSLAKPR